MQVRKAAAATLLLAFVLSAGCFRAKKRAANPPEAPTTVIVENHNWLETTVYAVRAGTRLRLGTVPTGRTLEFTLPTGFTTGANIQLIADPVGTAHTYRSDMLAVAPGSLVSLRVENNLRMSTVSIH